MESDITNNSIASKFAKMRYKTFIGLFFNSLNLESSENKCFHFSGDTKLVDYDNTVSFVRFSYDDAVIFV